MRVAILGPTASGKSALAVALARHVGATVVNGDPFQALRGLAIGTGQPAPEEQGGVPHLGYGDLPLTARPNPADFGVRVRGHLEGCPRAVLVTGSGLYLRGIWNQLSTLPPVPEAVVHKVRSWGARLATPWLHRYLQAVDPARAAQVHPNDASRIQRALALHLATGLRPSALMEGIARGLPEGWKALVVLPQRASQRQRVARRVRLMIEMGWPEEVAACVAAGHREDLLALRPLGYDLWLEGGDPDRCEARIVTATQAYARRQETFFRNQWPEVPTWDPDQDRLEDALARLQL